MSSPQPPRAERVRPWIALAIPPLAWMTFEYGLGSALRPACAAVGAWLGPAWGAAALIACGAAVVVAWPIARGDDAEGARARPWLAKVACGVAGVFALAIAFQTLATMIVPPCVR
ncbi:MAG TPA: hypothetical protein VFQ57_04810 [Sphingomonas sp.]|jgi:hypothetical protein|nr:hypothetical protein [Sphingomonas sp.]